MIKSLTLALILSIPINNNYLNTEFCYHKLLVNKQISINKEYKSELTIPNVKFVSPGNIEKNHMEVCAANALEKMFNSAKSDNINLVAISGYRSYERQEVIYNNNVKEYGIEYANIVSAKPGTSEHQTGLAMDISCESIDYQLIEKFENTKEGKWLQDNCYKYGFIIRYPKGKEQITGYIYEPWHVRYVGEDMAKHLYENNLTLEEYFF